MTDGSSSRKTLIGVILALVVGLVVVFVLWQNDRDSQDFNVDFNTGDAGTVVESSPQLAIGPPEGIRRPVG